jgi:hypothetical protein
VYGEQKARYPELNGRMAWGGAFGTQLGGGGAPDLMHFDLGGERGHWTQNLPSKMGPMPGVTYGPGAVDQQQTPPPTSQAPSAWPDQAKPMDDYSNYHPINNVKVDNRSDEDVSHAKSTSDNDDGSHQAESEEKSKTPEMSEMPEDI